jgi:uncharacterized membrane protein YdjX (TVP38/TMEM64 family)
VKNYSKKLKKKLAEYRSYVVLGVIFVILSVVGYEYYHRYIYVFRDPNRIKDIIMSYGEYGVSVFLLIQVLQVVAFFIPGEIIQIAGGYIYGTLFGSILSIIGITAGSVIDYGIARVYGRPLIDKIVSKRHLKFFDKVLHLGSVNSIVFLLYLIPGIPKDILAYICGVSSISLKNFVLCSTFARLPGIIVSAYFGAKMYSGNKILLVSIAVVMILLFVVGVLKGEKIISKVVKRFQSENNKQV